MNYSDRIRSAIREIAEWKADAKLEDSERYFYETSEAEKLINGSRSYVIGRKGTGKTAIAHHIESKKSYSQFSKHLSMKNFPWNVLYELKDTKYPPPNQYITIWKYTIYASVLHLMSQNEKINPDLTKAIKKAIPQDPSLALARSIREWTAGNFSFGLPSTLTVGAGAQKAARETELSWTERTEILEQAILDNIDEAKYFIVFDELDEDYRYQSIFAPNRQYLELIIGLFKAVQSIRGTFRKRANIFPVIFLRDDIFDLVDDPDKTKWRDLLVNLNWDASSIRPLLAFRIVRAFYPTETPKNFSAAWWSIIDRGEIHVGSRRQKPISIFDWITRHTMLRPRDYIVYLQLCASHVEKSNFNSIASGSVTTQSTPFSNYLRSEIRDEVQSVIPYIDSVFGLISSMRKNIFTFRDFETQYAELKTDGKLEAEKILQCLFYFSVIGNHTRSQKEIYRYRSPHARLNLREPVIVHPGLLKALQLF